MIDILNRPFVHDALMEQYKKESFPKVKAAILTALGELKAMKCIPQLKQISTESNNQMAIRAHVSLSTMNGESMSLEERRQSALKLCQSISSTTSTMSEERRLIAVGLRNLKVEDKREVFETLMKLLQDENGDVRLEAGRTLTVLKFVQ